MIFLRRFLNIFRTLNGLECPICLINISSLESLIIATNCGHFMCLNCASSISHNQCPFCRQRYSFIVFIRRFYCFNCNKISNIIRYFCTICGAILCESCLLKTTELNLYNFVNCNTCNQRRNFRRIFI